MLNKFIVAGSIALATAVSTPALAADAFPSFNGVNGNGNFTYGFTDFVTLTPFNTTGPAGGPCALQGQTTCLYSSTLGNLPQASVGGSFPTVVVPADALLVHPGNSDAQAVYAAYLAPVTSLYSFSINLQSVGIDTTNGVGYTLFTELLGVKTFGARSVLPTFNSSASLTGTQTLAAGALFGVIVDRNGNFGGDSTGLNFSISAVPEPATWAMMLVGFGMIGFAIRKRKNVRTTVAYA